ncbi:MULTISPECIES: DUF1206 domain-containing protein [unclassified Microbacterium]|uniref:DUF1206 domain-containing protein n=1 Tax=unclassified Microbacterium TaxID=2609290 RepID=UPI000EA95FC4|nr:MULTISPECIES: DUF1206 domain-containing protein [unclassified Microbacterium]MBT2484650.1 DUF1206 domain-containing protein [Microbacterium sp. ISL-108]RKN67540.1 DUF1206 domain-containing protein [Microbacterium sp. CGR2]
MGTVKHAARTAKDSSAFQWIARAGFVVVGVIHVIIGCLAVSLAVGAGGDADQDGAMEQIRQNPIGGLLLIGIAVGLLALAGWQIASAFLTTDPADTRKWGVRIKYFGISLAYLVIAALALIFAVGGRVESEKASQTLSAILLAAPAGFVLLVIFGLAVVGVGVGFIVSGFTKGFEKLLHLPEGAARAGIVTFGVIGYIGKGIAVSVTGVLFVVAAFTDNPDRAGGLDAALRSVLALPLGPFLLGAVGAGFAIYGLFCIARSRYARM